MLSELIQILALLFSGFIGGLFVGMGSGTAGAFIIPSITIFTSYSVHKAIGTSLVIDSIIGFVAGLIFIKNKNADLKSGILLAITGVVGAFIGSRYTSGASESTLNIILAILLIILGINFVFYGIQRNLELVDSKFKFDIFKKHKHLIIVPFGLLVGFVSGFSGMGVGGMVALVLFFVFGYNLHTAIGTSLIIMCCIAGSGAIGHAFSGEIVYSLIIPGGLSAIVGAVVGASYANKINANLLGRIIGVVIICFGIFIIIKTLF